MYVSHSLRKPRLFVRPNVWKKIFFAAWIFCHIPILVHIYLETDTSYKEGQPMEEIVSVFPSALRPLCRVGFARGLEPEEIRLRIGRPVMVLGKGGE